MGLSRTKARMLRPFTISSRSPVRRPKAFGNVIPLDGAGGSSGEDTGSASEVCGLTGSVLAGGPAFLPQAASGRRANKANTNTSARRVEIELHIFLLPPYSRVRVPVIRTRTMSERPTVGTADRSDIVRVLITGTRTR